MRRALIFAALLFQACDKPAAPAPPAPPPLAAAPPGILRISRSTRTPADLLNNKAVHGFPKLAVRLDYAGPRTSITTAFEAWRDGKKEAGETDHQMIHLPLADDAAFGFADAKTKDGKEATEVVVSMPVESAGSSGGASRTVSSLQFGVPLLKGKVVKTIEPTLPLEIADGKEVLLWAVFADEPADVPAAATPEERAKRADTAWLFRIRTADAKK